MALARMRCCAVRCWRPRLWDKAKVEGEKTMVVGRRGVMGWSWKEGEASASHAELAALVVAVVLLVR